MALPGDSIVDGCTLLEHLIGRYVICYLPILPNGTKRLEVVICDKNLRQGGIRDILVVADARSKRPYSRKVS
jgi:hypothetical protein